MKLIIKCLENYLRCFTKLSFPPPITKFEGRLQWESREKDWIPVFTGNPGFRLIPMYRDRNDNLRVLSLTANHWDRVCHE